MREALPASSSRTPSTRPYRNAGQGGVESRVLPGEVSTRYLSAAPSTGDLAHASRVAGSSALQATMTWNAGVRHGRSAALQGVVERRLPTASRDHDADLRGFGHVSPIVADVAACKAARLLGKIAAGECRIHPPPRREHRTGARDAVEQPQVCLVRRTAHRHAGARPAARRSYRRAGRTMATSPRARAARESALERYDTLRSCSSIHEVPNRSRSIANRRAKKVSSIGMKI